MRDFNLIEHDEESIELKIYPDDTQEISALPCNYTFDCWATRKKSGLWTIGWYGYGWYIDHYLEILLDCTFRDKKSQGEFTTREVVKLLPHVLYVIRAEMTFDALLKYKKEHICLKERKRTSNLLP